VDDRHTHRILLPDFIAEAIKLNSEVERKVLEVNEGTQMIAEAELELLNPLQRRREISARYDI
jgi:hypothetical protein